MSRMSELIQKPRGPHPLLRERRQAARSMAGRHRVRKGSGQRQRRTRPALFGAVRRRSAPAAADRSLRLRSRRREGTHRRAARANARRSRSSRAARSNYPASNATTIHCAHREFTHHIEQVLEVGHDLGATDPGPRDAAGQPHRRNRTAAERPATTSCIPTWRARAGSASG